MLCTCQSQTRSVVGLVSSPCDWFPLKNEATEAQDSCNMVFDLNIHTSSKLKLSDDGRAHEEDFCPSLTVWETTDSNMRDSQLNLFLSTEVHLDPGYSLSINSQSFYCENNMENCFASSREKQGDK